MIKNIVFIDSRVAGYETLIASLAADTQWYLLNAQEDGVEQMQRILADYSKLDSVQVVSHGSVGTLYLGNTVLNSDNLSKYQQQLQEIGASLSETGDILLYGCNVAQGAIGADFANSLAQLTDADVAASDNLTGQGGDWLLEQRIGIIEKNNITNPEWHGTLGGATIIQTDTIWRAGETINLTGDVQIAQGITLTIQQGVTVNGNGYNIQAFGTLKATGTTEEQISFNDTRFLFGNSYTNPGHIEISHADIENGAFLPATGYGSYGYFALTDSVLKSVDGFYIWYPTSSSRLERNIFLDCSGLSIGTDSGVQVHVTNNMFSGQTGAAVENWASYGGVNTIVSKNSFLSTDRTALSIRDGYSSSAMLAENNYFGTTDKATIANMIHDRSDTLEAASFIDYDPILVRPDSLTPRLPSVIPGLSLTGTSAADFMVGGEGNDTLTGLDGNDKLSGSNGDDSLIGGTGNDTLDGGTGSDEMVGGKGNDLYYVRDNGDVVTEAASEGTDTIYSYLASYTLGSNVENGRVMSTGTASLTGNDLGNVLYAGNGDNTLDGQAGGDTVSYAYASGGVFVNLQSAIRQDTESSGQDLLTGIENLTGSKYDDHLSGNAAANVLDGGAGADVLIGRGGNDTYHVDNTCDVIVETDSTAVGGTDTVNSALSAYTLTANVENGRVMGTGAASFTGNSLNNVIYAGAGNNVLKGEGGTDTLSYAYGLSSTTTVGVTVSLASTSSQSTGGSGTDTLSGFENLTGSSKNDKLTGSTGNNVLNGGAGNDTLTGSTGADIFRFDSNLSATTNLDRITDFNVVDDTIQLENSIFAKLTTTGTLKADFFSSYASTSTATPISANYGTDPADNYILYNRTTGALYYDADGSGTAIAAIQFATIVGTTPPVLTAEDLVVI